MAKYHLVGIGGIGMSALAHWLLEEGFIVSGSDLHRSPQTALLESLGAKISYVHRADLVSEGTTVIYSTDIPNGNPEIKEAERLKCPLFHRSEFVKVLVQSSPILAVTGSHGKTSTSSLLAETLETAALSPSFLIGGIPKRWGKNGRKGKGPWVVLEADESDGTFLSCHPRGAIVTNIDKEHLSFWKTEEALRGGFDQFSQQVEDPNLFFFSGDRFHFLKGTSYGFEAHNHLRILEVDQKGWSLFFSLSFEGHIYKNIELKHLGKHQAENGAAVFGLCLRLGIPEEAIREAFQNFHHVKRRVDIKGEHSEILFIDDYGHHPTEIKTTLEGIKKAFPLRRLVTVFQPHRYTRTLDCLSLFENTFDAADLVVLTDIYGAGESGIEGVNRGSIAEKISATPLVEISRKDLAPNVEPLLKPYDVVVSMGAGDITHFYDEIKLHLKPKKLAIGLAFGGESVEHEISLLSAKHVLEGFKDSHLEPILFGIDKKGGWHVGENALKILEGEPIPSLFRPIEQEVLNHLYQCDALFPVLHGTNGEEGVVQGMIELLKIGLIGCPPSSCQLAMDKDIAKLVFKRAGLLTSSHISLSEIEWIKNQDAALEQIETLFPFPLWVKPVHLGSSVGIQRVLSKEELAEAISSAFLFDSKILIEKEIQGREIEFLVMGNQDVISFHPGEILSGGQFYSYDAKYGPNQFQATPFADLPDFLSKKGQQLAIKGYQAIGCQGFARVDFFLDHENNFWINEINPIPGFTSGSLAPKIAHLHGLPIKDFVTQLVLLGLEATRRKLKIKRNI